MRNYRWILFTTCSVFLLTWLPHLLCGLVKAEPGLVELSLVSLTSGLLTTPIVHPGQVRSPQLRLVSGDYFQNKELQQVLKRIIRKPELENCELGILPIGEQPGKNEVQQENNEWWAVLRLQVRGPSQGRSSSLKVTFPGDQVGEEQQDGSEGGGDQTLGRHLLLPGSRVCRYWGLERD